MVCTRVLTSTFDPNHDLDVDDLLDEPVPALLMLSMLRESGLWSDLTSNPFLAFTVGEGAP